MQRADLAIQTIGLSKNFGNFTALKDLNLQIEPNSVYGFLGPNGSGKTTTIKLLTGLSQPSAGHSYIYGIDSADRSLQTRHLIGYLPDVPSFHKYMTGLQSLVLCGELFGFSHNDAQKRAYVQLERTGLMEAAHRKTGGYSRGMKQRLGLAAALIGDPRVLFLDEPVSALDPNGRSAVLEIIKDLKESKTIFLSTHILSDVERICDKVGIIFEGELIVSQNVSDLKKKYSQNRFLLRFDQDPTPLLAQIQRQAWCIDAHVGKNEEGVLTLLVHATDENKAKNELPQIATQRGFTLTRYEIVQPSLEDIFMQLTGARNARV